MKHWFTSDTHFGHANIIGYSNRPFASVEQMDAAMIERHNARVAPGDVVYHLGDFAWAENAHQVNFYLSRLNGQKFLIKGNHDRRKAHGKAKWAGVSEMLEVEVEGTRLVLCHYAMRAWNRSHHGALHLFGHSHGKLRGNAQSLDVGVDCWDFKPIALTEIKARMATLPRVGFYGVDPNLEFEAA